MRANLLLGSTIFADLDFKELVATPGLGFYRLTAQVQISTQNRPAEKAITLTDISGELRLQSAASHSSIVGSARPSGTVKPIKTYDFAHNQTISLEIELSRERIEAIEDLRRGGDLTFTLVFRALALGVPASEPEIASAELQYRANQSAWIKVLDQLEYRKTLLIEIPIPSEGVSPEMVAAVAYLRQAQEQCLHGRYREAVGACRDVLESLSPELNDDQGEQSNEIKGWFKGQREMSKEQRFQLVRRAVKVLTHSAHHADQVAKQIEWGPSDARAVLAMVAALLHVHSEGK